MAIEEILDDCLRRVAIGENLAECAKRYPDYAEELIPLLEAAVLMTETSHSIPVNSAARIHGRKVMMQALEKQSSRLRWKIPWFWKPIAKPFVVGFALVLITAIAAGGTTVASDSSVPGDNLYWIKTTKETIFLNMSGSNVRRANAHVNLASERGEEVRKLISAGRVDDAHDLASRITRHLGKSATLIDVMVPVRQIEMPDRKRQGPRQSMLKIRSNLQQDGSDLNKQLFQLWTNASPRDKVAIYQIMKRARLEYTLLIQALGGEEPRGGMFWIVKPSDRNLY
ncbi:MAG: DUF5667 domain-containing protein [Chloroflexota bacterium]|nr:DUF5667 domain-containing protein [Chloroflexota bacterium]